MEIKDFQRSIEKTYFAKDDARGVPATFVWFVEEVGELARAIKSGDAENMREEFSDVLAWLSTLASLCDVSLQQAAMRYADGCPKCDAQPCACGEQNAFTAEKPAAS